MYARGVECCACSALKAVIPVLETCHPLFIAPYLANIALSMTRCPPDGRVIASVDGDRCGMP